MQNQHEHYIDRCLNLAENGLGKVAPNPMVGAVIVNNNQIIGEGWHQEYGSAHAEVNAIASVQNRDLLKDSTLYVNLEPCSHFGKTPPCADLIISSGIPRVVIANQDPFPEVSGRGIARLRQAGIEVISEVKGNEGRFLNRRFMTFHEKKRPYIILKWAETKDGFIDMKREPDDHIKPQWITNQMSKRLVHKWRTEEQGIMIGTNTALYDDPQLTARLWEGKQPIRIVLDRQLRLPAHLHVLDQSVSTLVYTEITKNSSKNIDYVSIRFDQTELVSIMNNLYSRNIQSIIVEGGTELLVSFISQNLWDEARVFIGNKHFRHGVAAPAKPGNPQLCEAIGSTDLLTFFNPE